MKKRKVLSLWKAICLVILGIMSVVGITVLSLYLTGGFNEKKIEPEDLSFSRVIPTGDALYDSDVDQYQVSSDFKLTINSTTEGVTANNVTLSLKNGRVQDGFVSDGVIKVPQIVTLNKEFTIMLEKEYSSTIGEDWVVGGLSELTAKSENVLLPAKRITIAVDVPVYKIDLSVSGADQNQQVQEVVKGSVFEIETRFTPENSKKVFFKDGTEKEIFYDFTKQYIDFDWQNKQFIAKEESASFYDTITVYTFSNSYHQKQIMKRFESVADRQTLTANVLAYFRDNQQTCVFESIGIKVLNVDIDEVSFDINGKTLKTNIDKYFNLTVASSNGNGSLGAIIKDSFGTQLNSLFSNIAIKIPKNENNINIVGGKVMKVVSGSGSTTITELNYDKDFDYANSSEDTEYYIRPNISPSNFADYSWQISTSSIARDYTLYLNFFFENQEGYWQTYFDLTNEKYAILSAEIHSDEEPPAFTNNEIINMVITYDANGNIKPATVNLSDMMNEINSNNVYRTVKYFLFADEETPSNFDMATHFVCAEGKSYSTNYLGQPLLIGQETMPESGYVLYEVDGMILNAIKSFSGKVNLVVATIQTDASNKPYLQDGKYNIVQTSRVKEVVVESTLSILNMEASYSFVDGIVANQEKENQYYIPSINKNESGDPKTVIKFQLALNESEDEEKDVQKILQAFNTDKTLKVVCVDNEGIETQPYLTLQSIVYKESQGDTLLFEGNFIIEEGFFKEGVNFVDTGVFIKLQLQYNDGKHTYTKNITQLGIEENEHFYIYYQQPVTLVGEYQTQKQNNFDLDNNGEIDEIDVRISTSGISLTWGNLNIENQPVAQAMDTLNSLLSYKIYDQYGNEINTSNGVYKYSFVEVSDNGEEKYIEFNSSLDKIASFISTQGQPKHSKLSVQILNADKQIVKKVDSTGAVTNEEFVLNEIGFNIVSEGISSVKIDKSTTVNSGAEGVEYVLSDNISSVTVKKYVTAGSNINLQSLMQVFTTSQSGEEVQVDSKVFTLDNSSLSAMSETAKIDIMKMISFTLEGGESPVEDASNIENYRGKKISQIIVINPFKEDTDLRFSVKDLQGTLFDISLRFVMLSDIRANSNFNEYYEANSEFLVQKGNSPSVFGGEKYDIDQFVSLNSNKTQTDYSWAKACAGINLESSINGVFYEGQEIATLIHETAADGVGKVYLNIKEVYQYKTITFTLYYKVNSIYACSITISLYVNPNIVVRQKVENLADTPYIELSAVGIMTFNDFYEIHSVTKYINNGRNFSADTLFNDKDSNSYPFSIKVASDSLENNFIGFSKLAGGDFSTIFSGESMSLNLGEVKIQSFNMWRTITSNTEEMVDALKIVEDAKMETQIIRYSDEQRLKFDFEIGVGKSVETMANEIFENAEAVVYQDETYLLLLATKEYAPTTGFVIESSSVTGDLTYSIGKLKVYAINEFVSIEGNQFSVRKDYKDNLNNEMQVLIGMKAIVSKIGKTFVEYTNMTDKTFDVLIGDYHTLQLQDVYQQLDAGKDYEIMHDEAEAVSGNQTVEKYGFHINKTLTGITNKISEFKVSIVEDANGYVDGLAEIINPTGGATGTEVPTLKINHLETAYENAYIVLKCEVKAVQGGANFVWYYRIKVNPSFTAGNVTYPYNDVGEYLNQNSDCFNFELNQYEIDFNEKFKEENSAHKAGAKRFGEISWSDSNQPTNITEVYKVKSVFIENIENEIDINDYLTYFETLAFNGSKLTIKLKPENAQLRYSITVEKTYKVNNKEIIGSEREYILKINNGSTYVHTLTQGEVSLTNNQNIYKTTISAGSDETTFSSSIKIVDSNVESDVTEYDAYVKDDGETLMYTAFVKKGVAKYDNADNPTNIGTVEESVQLSTWYENKEDFEKTLTTEYYKVNNGQEAYFVKREDISIDKIFMSGNELKIKTKAFVNADTQVEIGYFTNEGIVFKLEVVVSYVSYEINNAIKYVGGKTYNLFGEDGIISSLASKTKDIDSITISLSENVDSLGNLSIKENNGNAETKGSTITITENQIEIAEIENANGKFEIALKDSLVGELSFAYLNNDTIFTILVDINYKLSSEGNEVDATKNSFSFAFELTVLKNFDDAATRQHQNTKRQYGDVEYNETIADIISNLKLEPRDNIDIFKFVSSENSDYIVKEEGSKISITPKPVATITNVDVMLKMAYFFGTSENQILTFTIRYRYTVYPNVEISTNYPSPDEVSVLSQEYIETSESKSIPGIDYVSAEYKDFFNTSAPFSKTARIVANQIPTEPITNTYEISVSSISNAEIYVKLSDSGATKTINNASTNKVVVENNKVSMLCNLQFGLINSASEGLVSFEVKINEVSAVYNVVIVAGSVVKVSTNTPNYSNNEEIVYAEDLLAYEEQTLFAQNRIINFTLSEIGETNKPYFARFDKGTEIEVRKISSSVAGQTTNIDAGKSLKGFAYQGTYLSEADAINDRNQCSDSLYSSVPTLTSRIVLIYYDNTPITLSDNTYLKVVRASTQTSEATATSTETNKADDFKLESSDFEKTLSLTISAKVGDTDVSTGGTYNIKLDAELIVEKNANDSTNYETWEIEAGTQKNLLSDYSYFGFKNKRTGIAYNKEIMKESKGSIALSIWGFKGTEIKEKSDDDLSQTAYLSHAAYEIDQNLRKTNTDGIQYSTGLSPRAGMELNGMSSTDGVTKNYLTYSGIQEGSGKDLDFLIKAQGANNDGNHVMLKFTYSVEVNGNTISREYNLLFKVSATTNNNSNVQFKSRQDSSEIYNSASTEIVNGQTVASNKENPYQIESGDSTATMYLWNSGDNNSGENASAIKVALYGAQNINNANRFKYTYTKNISEGYNDLDQFANDFGWQNKEGTNIYEPSQSTEFVRVVVCKLELGERNFMFEAENEFGYKIRFYIHLKAPINPEIKSMSSYTLTEGSDIAVGLEYKSATPMRDAKNYVQYNTFDYEKNISSGEYVDEITITNETTYAIKNAYLIAQGNWEGGTIYKEISSYSQNPTAIKISDGEWKYSNNNTTVSFANDRKDFFKGAKITLSLNIERNTQSDANGNKTDIDDAVGLIGVTYNSNPLQQTYVNASSYTQPTFESEGNLVTLTGIDAYAFDNTLGAIDKNSLQNSFSNFKNLKVEKVEFYLGETCIGSSYYTNEQTLTTSSNAPSVDLSISAIDLFTDSGVSFAYSDSDNNITTERGLSYKKTENSELGHNFIVPYINGFYYGTGNTLSNVKMNITLINDTGAKASNVANRAVLSKYITLQRETETNDLFQNSDIADNTQPNIIQGGATVLNDTFEVVMPSNTTVSFVLHNEEIKSLEGTTLTNSKNETLTANIITLTNNRNYAVTEYVSISSSIVGLTENLNDTSEITFYALENINSTGVIFSYNGINIEKSNIGSKFTIGKYNNITLNIEDVAELNSQKYKAETLYFVANVANNNTDEVIGRYYRFSQTFNVYPEFKSATHTTTDTQGNPFYGVDYYTVSPNSLSEQDANTYYIITREHWTTGITYERHVVGDDTPPQWYKVSYEISNAEEGAGSAFIDEMGLITTKQGFNISGETITIKMYMKVSGQDASFENKNTKLLLGTFTIFLNPGLDNSTPLIPNSITNNPIVVGVEGDSTTGIGAMLLVEPSGYTIYTTGSSANGENLNWNNLSKPNYSCQVGETIEFEDLMEEFTSEIGFNRNYHLVSFTKDTTTTNIVRDNLNSYTFVQAGTYTLNFVITGRTAINDVNASFESAAVNLVVYPTNNQISIDEAIQLIGQEATLKIEHEGLTDAYLIGENGKLTSLKENSSEGGEAIASATENQTNFIYKFNEQGIHNLTVLAVFQNEYKLLNYRVAVYEESKTVNITVGPRSAYAVSNINSGEMYLLQNYQMSRIYTEVFDLYGEGSSLTRTYISNNNNQIIKYEATYHFASTTASNLSIVTNNAPKFADVKQEIAKSLNIEAGNIESLWKVDNNGIMEKITEMTLIAGNVQTVKYFVKTTNLAVKYKRIDITFYVVQDEKTINFVTTPNTAFSLAELNSAVKEAVNSESAQVSYYVLNASGRPERVETISIEEDITKTYYVGVEDSYYLITFNLFCQKADLIYNDSTFKADAINQINLNRLPDQQIPESAFIEWFSVKQDKTVDTTMNITTFNTGVYLACISWIENEVEYTCSHVVNLTVN